MREVVVKYRESHRALLLNEELETAEIVSRAGYRYFTDVDSLKKYVEQEILVATEVSR